MNARQLHLRSSDMNGPAYEQDDVESQSADDGDISADSSHDDTPPSSHVSDLSLSQEEQELREIAAKSGRFPNEDPGPLTCRERSSFENKAIIEKAREYQQELFERAKEENIVAVLDTGMGKTLIAAMLIRHTLEKGLIESAEGTARKAIFFLANR